MIDRLRGRVGLKQLLSGGKYINNPSSPHYIKSYKVRSGILKDIFKGISQMIILEGYDYKIPHGLGRIYIRRFRPKSKKRHVDWFNTKKYGKIIYHYNNHSNGYAAEWKWDKYRTLAKGIAWYKFSPTRTNSRNLAKAIKEKNTISEYRVLW